MAKITPEYPGVTLTDYMSLIKVDGEWRIVNKIFPRESAGDQIRLGRGWARLSFWQLQTFGWAACFVMMVYVPADAAGRGQRPGPAAVASRSCAR